jgi:hypothetical protein
LNAARTIEADPIDGRVVVHRRVVDVMDNGRVDAGHASVIEILSTAPVTTVETSTRIAEAIVDSTVETNDRSPIADVPHVKAVSERPVPWRPKQTDFRWKYPGTGNPVIPIRVVISPIAGNPDKARLRANGLNIHWQRRRSNLNRNAYSSLCGGLHWDREQSNCKQQRTNGTSDTHDLTFLAFECFFWFC